MKKSYLWIMIVMILGLVLSACSPEVAEPVTPAEPEASIDVEDAEEENVSEPEKVYDIAIVPKEEADQWFKHMAVNGVDVFAEETGHNAYSIGPSKLDAALQVQIITDLIGQGVDAIGVVPIDPDALNEVLNTAREQGIVVIAHEAEEMSSADFDIEPVSGAEYGAAMMDALAKSMNYEGVYAPCVGELTAVSHMLWMEAAIERAEKEYPNMVLAKEGIYESGDNQERAYESTKELLRANPDISGLLFAADVAGIGGAIAVDEMGLSDKIHIVATGIPSISGDYVRDGLIDALTVWDPAQTAYAMCVLAVEILENGVESIGTEFNGVAPGYENMTRSESSNTFFGSGGLIFDKSNIDDESITF